jgi:hypothetical protein
MVEEAPAMAVQSQDLRSPVRNSSKPATRPLVAVPSASLHTVVYGVTILLVLLVIYAIMGSVVTWSREKIDDLRYGPIRTFHTEAVVGHGDSEGSPSRFIAVNLNRQVVIMEIPAGDTSQMRTITGPYLVGAGEDKTPVLLSFEDVNKDGTRDMVVNVKNEAIIFVNRDGQFLQMSNEERAQIVSGS